MPKWSCRNITKVSTSFVRELVPSKPNAGVNQDLLITSIKSSHDSIELLDMVTKYSKDLEATHCAQTLQKLFALQKSQQTSQVSQILRHPNFDNFCRVFKSKSATLELNELVDSLKILNYFGLRSDSSVVVRLLHMVKEQINDLSLGHLLFLNFLFKKMDRTPLIEAISLAIPLVFDIQLSTKLDHNNTQQLTEMLQFATTVKVSDKNIMAIVTALTIHGESLTVDEAKSVVWSFSQMKTFDHSYDKLLFNVMKVLNDNYMKMSFESIEITISKMIDSIVMGNMMFYDEKFFNNCVQHMIETNIGFVRSIYILKKFNRIGFISLDLLDYVDKQIIKNPSNLSACKPTALFNFASSFSLANHKSQNWPIIKSVLLEHPLLQSDKNDLPWFKFASEMASLGFFSKILLQKLFSSSFLDYFLARENNYLDNIQMLLLCQSVKLHCPEYDGKYPAEKFLSRATQINLAKNTNMQFKNVLAYVFGGEEFVQCNVASSLGHCLEFVLTFDDKMNPVPSAHEFKKYDELPKNGVKS
ncbi:unnamed protein product [Diamesa tonsa]